MPTLLICDDEQGILDVLTRFFTGQGHRVFSAVSAATALEAAAAHPPSVLVADIGLKGSSGFDLYESFKKDFPNVPVIFTTGQPSQETAMKALRAGAFDYLIKPFHLDEISKRIERALESKRLREENLDYSRLVSLHAVANQMAAATSHEALRDDAIRLGAKLLTGRPPSRGSRLHIDAARAPLRSTR
jgi:DNA-binding NtrC family response regulator